MNGWEDVNLIAEVNRIGKSRLALASLWTGVCIVGPALSAIEQGFEICVITDACGDVSDEADERAVQRNDPGGRAADDLPAPVRRHAKVAAFMVTLPSGTLPSNGEKSPAA